MNKKSGRDQILLDGTVCGYLWGISNTGFLVY